ncbi:MAG: hypothetical protein EOP21_01790 [Hyphomicrobiales bacterium]|nr:MAG: hypothetical protein EOP21_01790 [Hyphomicrobiales bacterium]
MNDDTAAHELHDIVSERISSLVLEMEEANWGAQEVIDAVSNVISAEWLPKFRALAEARQATPTNFVSDGNEG